MPGGGKKPETALFFCVSWLDYGARMYDPAIARWMVIDPAIEDEHYNYTPYAYVYNNPVRLIDPLGLDSTDVNTEVVPEETTVQADATNVEEPVEQMDPTIPNCDDMRSVDLSLEADLPYDISVSKDGISAKGVNLTKTDGIDIGVVALTVDVKDTKITEMVKNPITGQEIPVTTIYHKTVTTGSFMGIQAKTCSVTDLTTMKVIDSDRAMGASLVTPKVGGVLKAKVAATPFRVQ